MDFETMNFPPEAQRVVIVMLFLIASGISVLQRRRRKSTIDEFLALYRRGDFEAALQALEGLRKEPIPYSSLRAGVLMQLGDLDEAEKLLRQSIALAEQRAPAVRGRGLGTGPAELKRQMKLSALRWETLGELHLERQRYDEAIRCFETSLRDWPDRGSSHRVIAETWLRRGDSPSEALKWAKLAVEEDRAAEAMSQLVGDTNLAEDLATLAWAVAVASHDGAEVDRLVAEAVSLVGNLAVTSSAQVQYQSGLAYAALGDSGRSAQHFKEAARIDQRGRWGRAARMADSKQPFARLTRDKVTRDDVTREEDRPGLPPGRGSIFAQQIANVPVESMLGSRSWASFLGWCAVLVLCLVVWYWIRTSAHPQVKVVYLVPKNLSPRKDFPEAARRALIATQRWYFDELQHGVTFALAKPLVDTVQTAHTENWYRSAAGDRGDREALWRATIEEAFKLTGGSYNDRRYVWVYFLDADLPAIPPQGTSGVTLFLREEILNLVGPQAKCATIGTIAHEIGHALGVDHPPDCDSHQKDDSERECASMSYIGDLNFPGVRFLPEERSRLLRNSAFVAIKPEASAIECSKQDSQP
jgi:tetratricopeptide (TPR) repeat protein